VDSGGVFAPFLAAVHTIGFTSLTVNVTAKQNCGLSTACCCPGRRNAAADGSPVFQLKPMLGSRQEAMNVLMMFGDNQH
jgi:hypothetical protein